MNFKRLVKPYRKQLIKTLDYFVSIPSVYDKESANEEMPYGKDVSFVLHEFAKVGDMYGFDVELDKHYVELSYGTSGPLIEIYGHLDVVPVNKLAKHDPFKMRIEKDKIYGRGVADDKGPLLASLYAIKALKDNDLIKDVRIKIFAGGDEENGSSCLSYYVNEKKKEMPKFGFTPDSGFPLIYGEKGVGGMTYEVPIEFNHIISIKGGLASNIVIPNCVFKVDNIDEIKDLIKEPHKINGDEITFIGKPSHGSTPELGINAFLLGLKTLGEIYKDEKMINFAELFFDYEGKKLEAHHNSTHLKNTTYNIGIVNYENKILTIMVNVRFPEGVNPHDLSAKIANKLNAKLIKENYSDILLFDLDSPLVKHLLDAYQKETGDYETKPRISGGGTYAKEVKNTIAFGMEPHDIDYKMHQDDEFVNKKDLFKAMAIYAHAIYNLINDEK